MNFTIYYYPGRTMIKLGNILRTILRQWAHSSLMDYESGPGNLKLLHGPAWRHDRGDEQRRHCMVTQSRSLTAPAGTRSYNSSWVSNKHYVRLTALGSTQMGLGVGSLLSLHINLFQLITLRMNRSPRGAIQSVFVQNLQWVMEDITLPPFL